MFPNLPKRNPWGSPGFHPLPERTSRKRLVPKPGFPWFSKVNALPLEVAVLMKTWCFEVEKGSLMFDNRLLGGGFKYFYFHPYLGKIPILTNIFQMG